MYPEPYRRDASYDHLRLPASDDLEAAAGTGTGEEEVPEVVATLRRAAQRRASRPSRGTMSINVHEELDQGEGCQRVLKVGLAAGAAPG